MMESGSTINLFLNRNMIKNRLNWRWTFLNFLTNSGSKIVHKVGEITGAGQINSIQK